MTAADRILQPNVAGVSPPVRSPEAEPWWDALADGELRYQRCDGCGAANFGPGRACSSCQGTALSWHLSTGLGRVWSWTVVWRPPTPAWVVPYAPAIIRMDDGFDILSALIGLTPDAITDGLRVRVDFHPLADGTTLPFFTPA